MSDELFPATADADWLAPADVALAEKEARIEASDARIDETVRKSAVEAFRDERPAPPSSPPDGRSFDERVTADLTATMEKIQARKPEPVMPPLRPGASIDEAAEASAAWLDTPKATQRLMSDGARELANLKAAAEGFGIKCETASDLAALRGMLGLGKAQANGAALAPDLSAAISPDAPDKALDHLGKMVRTAQQGPQGWREVLQSYGYSPQDLMSPQEQAALSGAHGGELGAAVARHMPALQHYGMSPARAFDVLMAANTELERDPARAIGMLAQSYALDLGSLGGGEQAHVVEAFAAAKGQALTPQVRQLMAEVVQEPGFGAEGVPLLSLLQAAYTEAKRRLGRHARRDPSKKLEDAVDRAAAEVYG